MGARRPDLRLARGTAGAGMNSRARFSTGYPLADAIHGEDRGVLERRREERARGVRLVVLAVVHVHIHPLGLGLLAHFIEDRGDPGQSFFDRPALGEIFHLSQLVLGQKLWPHML